MLLCHFMIGIPSIAIGKLDNDLGYGGIEKIE
jgi:hypothetical protein